VLHETMTVVTNPKVLNDYNGIFLSLW